MSGVIELCAEKINAYTPTANATPGSLCPSLTIPGLALRLANRSKASGTEATFVNHSRVNNFWTQLEDNYQQPREDTWNLVEEPDHPSVLNVDQQVMSFFVETIPTRTKYHRLRLWRTTRPQRTTHLQVMHSRIGMVTLGWIAGAGTILVGVDPPITSTTTAAMTIQDVVADTEM